MINFYIGVSGLKEFEISLSGVKVSSFCPSFLLVNGNSLILQVIDLCLWLACRHTVLVFDSCCTFSNVFAICLIFTTLQPVVALNKHLARKFWFFKPNRKICLDRIFVVS